MKAYLKLMMLCFSLILLHACQDKEKQQSVEINTPEEVKELSLIHI